jgi:hypothetical protein
VAIQFCIECGKQVSDRAASCPHCGHPVQGASAPQPSPQPPVVPVKKNSHPVLTVIGGAAVVVLVLGIVALVVFLKTAKSKFEVTDKITDTNCTKLTDFCIDVNCTYQNAGTAKGTLRVRAQLLDKNSGEVKADRYSDLNLGPGESQRVTFSFPEAELDWEVSSVCKVDSEAGAASP